MMNLTTRYLGLELRSPLVASAGPLTSTAEGIQELADAGVGAVVLPSVFEEQLRQESNRDSALASAGTNSHPEAAGYLPGVSFDAWPHEQLRVLEKAADSAGIPVIASLNGVTPGGWTHYAAAMQDAGAAAIELNVYYLSGDPLRSARSIEIGYAEMLTRVKGAVSIPVAVKIAPYAGAPGETAQILDHAGADGLVLFNRFQQADIDPETLTASAGFSLSSSGEGALPRAWISMLRGRVRCSLAASTGVETAADVAAYLLAGADVVMTTSALLRHGPGYATELLGGLIGWMRRKGFTSVADARGLLSAKAGHAVPGRSGYLSALHEATHAFG